MVALKFLEAEVHVSFERIAVLVINKNEAFAFSGDPSRIGKKSLVPFTGSLTKAQLQLHRAELKGRLRRWSKHGLDDFNWMVLFCTDILYYLRMGFPRRVLDKIWKNI